MADIKIYRTTYCHYCNLAQRLLDELGLEYEKIDVTQDAEKREELIEHTGMRTVPQIFINGESVGGFTDLKALHDSGELDELL